jgi:quinol monooxygenase YgiN
MIAARVQFTIDSARADDFAKAAESVAGAMRASPGCLRAAFYREVADPDAVLLCHEWDSRDAFQAYRSSPSFGENGKRLGPFIVGAPQTTLSSQEVISG